MTRQVVYLPGTGEQTFIVVGVAVVPTDRIGGVRTATVLTLTDPVHS